MNVPDQPDDAYYEQLRSEFEDIWLNKIGQSKVESRTSLKATQQASAESVAKSRSKDFQKKATRVRIDEASLNLKIQDQNDTGSKSPDPYGRRNSMRKDSQEKILSRNGSESHIG